MTKPNVHKMDLELLEEPDDLWNRLFLSWLKNLGEQNTMTLERLGVLEHSITQLNSAIAKLLPEQPDDLLAAMKALQDLQEVSKEQSTRGLDNIEKMTVITNQIIANQKSG